MTGWARPGLQVAATCLGRAERALQHAVEYAAERKQFGQQIGKFQGISFKLADMATELKAAELLTWHGGWKFDQGTVTETDMSMAKLKATEMLAMVADEAIQIHGGMGLMDELPLERIWRDARVERIWEGTSEIQRHIISREMLRPLGGVSHAHPAVTKPRGARRSWPIPPIATAGISTRLSYRPCASRRAGARQRRRRPALRGRSTALRWTGRTMAGVRSLVITPAGVGWHIPKMLYLFGGGFILGSPQEDLMISAALAAGTGLQVVSPAYALAPEAPFPAGLEDAISGRAGPSSRAPSPGNPREATLRCRSRAIWW